MRLVKININDIKFNYTSYNQSLYDSIYRIGFSFPIKIEEDESGYKCIDGHKRLSVLKDILTLHPDYHRGEDVTVIIINNGNTRSNDCWRGRNTH